MVPHAHIGKARGWLETSLISYGRHRMFRILGRDRLKQRRLARQDATPDVAAGCAAEGRQANFQQLTATPIGSAPNDVPMRETCGKEAWPAARGAAHVIEVIARSLNPKTEILARPRRDRAAETRGRKHRVREHFDAAAVIHFRVRGPNDLAQPSQFGEARRLIGTAPHEFGDPDHLSEPF